MAYSERNGQLLTRELLKSPMKVKKLLDTESNDEQFLKKLLEMQQILFFEPSKIIKNGFNLLKQRKGIIKIKKDVKYLLKVTR